MSPEPVIAFRTVHPDFRSSRGFVWPFPGRIARAAGPFTNRKGGCPQAEGDGICLATTWEGAASGGIPAITVLVCSYLPADLLGQQEGKVRVKKAKVLRVVDFPATLRGDVPMDDALPANLMSANLGYADLMSANLEGANLMSANLEGANLMSADLMGANLRGANLMSADLMGANLRGANLRGVNLEGANLRGANLEGVDLMGANLEGANLRYANLRYVNLEGADLMGANLRGANLEGADLRYVNLRYANLEGVDLMGANLRGANLRGANLEGADLGGAMCNEFTVPPAGWTVNTATGRMERVK